MTDRPIIFSAPMVRALLDGRKTQTRRVLKPQPFQTPDGWGCVDHNGSPQKWLPCLPGLHRYAPGDRLWVREVWHPPFAADDDSGGLAVYRATTQGPEPHRWRSPIHMPRWASRLTLHVTEVRVQRLQEISAEDVQAEGACELAFVPPTDADTAEARAIFRALWNSLHGPDAWDANPWVCAVSFTVERANIDATTPTGAGRADG
jgi:hypothetical protein